MPAHEFWSLESPESWPAAAAGPLPKNKESISFHLEAHLSCKLHVCHSLLQVVLIVSTKNSSMIYIYIHVYCNMHVHILTMPNAPWCCCFFGKLKANQWCVSIYSARHMLCGLCTAMLLHYMHSINQMNVVRSKDVVCIVYIAHKDYVQYYLL